MALTDKNLFAYCDNNPVVRADDNGKFWHILVGAAVGVATQYIFDVASNLVSGQSFVEALTPKSTWADYGAAALSGALAATGIGLTGSFIANAAISGTAYLINCEIDNKEANLIDFGLAAGAGGISSFVGGRGADGARLRGIVQTAKRALTTATSSKKIAMYTAKIVSSQQSAIVSGLRTIAAGLTANQLNVLRKLWTLSEN